MNKMANSDYLIAGNDGHGLAPLATGGGMLTPLKKSIFIVVLLFYINF
jgi:hypothetical protein